MIVEMFKPQFTEDGRTLYVLDGPPISRTRPRWSNRTNSMYSDQHEEMNATCDLLRIQHGSNPQLLGPLWVEIHFYMRVPSGKRIQKRWHTTKPDIDNLEKFYYDACVKVGIMKDDSQICRISSFKVYDINPRVEFSFRVLE